MDEMMRRVDTMCPMLWFLRGFLDGAQKMSASVIEIDGPKA